MASLMPLYDAQQNRLVYAGRPATDDFWTAHWHAAAAGSARQIPKRSDPLIARLTRAYLPRPAGTRVIDAGCGLGQHVARLTELGYDAYGVDFAKPIIDHLRHVRPELKISHGDVRHLPFPAEYFHGYWSIGVIEHFFDGYDEIAAEMHRVLTPRGFLFLTFPHVSALRRIKAHWRLYEPYDSAFDTAQFYQFALDARRVTNDFERRGFRLRYRSQTDGIKGFKDEMPFLKPVLQRLYDSPHLPARAAKVALSQILLSLTGHSAVLVLQKQ